MPDTIYQPSATSKQNIGKLLTCGGTVFARTFAGIVARFCEAKTIPRTKHATRRGGMLILANTVPELLFLRLLVHGLLPAPLAVLLEFDFTLNFFLVFA